MPNSIRLSVACTLLLSAVLGLSTSTHAATLADMRNVGTMSFCLNPEAMPYSQRDAGENSPGNGYLYELSIELIKRLQLSPRVVWLNSLERLNKTDCDLVPSAIVEKKDLAEQRGRIEKNPEKVFNRLFTAPFNTASGFLVSKSNKYKDFESLKATHVAVPSVSYAQVIFNQMKVPIWVRFLTDEDIINAVREDEAGAGLVTRTGFEWYEFVNGSSGLVKLDIDVDNFELDADIGMLLRSADQPALLAVEQALKAMVDDGFTTRAMKKYGITHHPPKR
ncbi:MAG: substrate-binding periplasmic protein [Betaproteobacteria bacterium]